MKCRQCGKPIEKKNKICPHCGHDNSFDIPSELKHYTNQELKKHAHRLDFFKKHRFKVVIGICLLVLVVFAYQYFSHMKQTSPIPNFHDDLIEKKSSNALGNNVFNITNGGLLLQSGNEIYATDGNTISRISLSLNKKEIILNEKASHLNLSDTGFYYISTPDHVVCHYDFSTKKVEKTDFQAIQLHCIGNYLYYLESSQNRAIYQFNKETKELKKMTPSGCIQFEIIGDWLYFTTDSALYQMPVLGGEITQISDESYNHFYVDNQIIYYIDSFTHEICSVKKDGTDQKVVINIPSTCFLMTDQYLFYAKEEGGIVKLNRENGESSLITNDQATKLHLASTWIYYISNTNEGRFVSIDENSETITPVDVISEH